MGMSGARTIKLELNVCVFSSRFLAHFVWFHALNLAAHLNRVLRTYQVGPALFTLICGKSIAATRSRLLTQNVARDRFLEVSPAYLILRQYK